MAIIDVISVENMRKSDAYTIENYVSSKELMWRAASGIYKSYSSWKNTTYVAVVAGSGNNGGDGYALSVILKNNGINVHVFSLGNHMSEDSEYYSSMARDNGVQITKYTEGILKNIRPDVIVDCLLGTGFKGTPREEYITTINEINACKIDGSKVISADINSGLNGDSGEYEYAINSDITVAIGFLKKGLISGHSKDVIGSITVVDIGIELLTKEDAIDSDSLGITLLSST